MLQLLQTPSVVYMILLLLFCTGSASAYSYNSGYYNNYNNNGYSSSYTDTYTNSITVPPQTTFVQPLTFQRSRFDYDEFLNAGATLGINCTGDKILISKLYISGTCIQERDLESSGCPSSVSNGTTVSGGSSTAQYSTTDTSAQANQVFTNPENYVKLSTVQASNRIDGAIDVCAPSTNAYIYVQNNCPSNSGLTTLSIGVRVYTGYSSGCSSSSWPEWASIVIICVMVLAVLVCMIASWQRRKRRYNQPVAVQMASPVGSVPPPMYGNNGTGGVPPPMYYAGGPTDYGNGGMQQPVQGYPPPDQQGSASMYPPPQQQQQSGNVPAVNQDAIWHAGTVQGYPKV